MSDQEIKVVEGAEAPQVDTTETKPTPADVETKAEEAKPADSEMADAGADKTNVQSEAADSNADKAENASVSVRNPPRNMLKVKRPDHGKKEEKNKFDPSVLGDSSDATEIRTQVHFYFSDSNLTTDKFLSELTGLAENKPVPLATICSFKRMHRYKPHSAVVSALKDSDFLTLEGEEGQETIQRKKAFDPTKSTKFDERSIYVKGFGEEVPSTQFDIEAFFAQYGAFNSVRLRRGDKGGFKGSVFVEWVDKEAAEKFMALDPKPQWKEHDLLVLWKVDYQKEKNDMIKSGALQASSNNNRSHRGRRDNRGRGGDRPDTDPRDWKKRRDDDQKNGHNDRRGGRDRGRGRGRGGRGRGGNQRRGRDHDDERRPRGEDAGEGRDNGTKNDATAAKAPETKEANGSSNPNGKRAHEDGAQDAPPAKKVDAKQGVSEAA